MSSNGSNSEPCPGTFDGGVPCALGKHHDGLCVPADTVPAFNLAGRPLMRSDALPGGWDA